MNIKDACAVLIDAYPQAFAGGVETAQDGPGLGDLLTEQSGAKEEVDEGAGRSV